MLPVVWKGIFTFSFKVREGTVSGPWDSTLSGANWDKLTFMSGDNWNPMWNSCHSKHRSDSWKGMGKRSGMMEDKPLSFPLGRAWFQDFYFFSACSATIPVLRVTKLTFFSSLLELGAGREVEGPACWIWWEMNCRNAWDCFYVAWNLSTTVLTASVKRPDSEMGGILHKGLFFFPESLNYRCFSAATGAAVEQPMAWAVCFVENEMQIYGPVEFFHGFGPSLLSSYLSRSAW